MTSTGTTMICRHCKRPVISPVVFGGGGEPYHPECTQSPYREPAKDKLARNSNGMMDDMEGEE